MNFDIARKNLIEQQIKSWNIYDPVAIRTLYSVKRENFVPLEYKSFAFSDFQIPIGFNEFMMSPMVEARILQASIYESTNDILEIGCGSGFMAAMLSQVCKSVVTVESNLELVKNAQNNFRLFKAENIKLFKGNGLVSDDRWSNKQFDVIVISGGIRTIPFFLEKSIKKNGKILAFLGSGPLMKAVSFRRNYSGGFVKNILFETGINHLKSEDLCNSFQF